MLLESQFGCNQTRVQAQELVQAAEQAVGEQQCHQELALKPGLLPPEIGVQVKAKAEIIW